MDSLLVAIRVVIIGFSLLGFFYLCGAGVTKLLLPGKLKPNEILIAPIVGVAVFIMLAYTLSYAGLGANIWIWLVLAIVLGIDATAGITIGWRTGFTVREHLVPLLIFTAVFAIGVAPAVGVGYLTNIGATGDVINYCFPADYLINHGLRNAAMLPPTTSLNAICHSWFTLGARLGTNLLVAGTDSLFGLESYQVFFALINLLMSLTVLSAWVLCRNGLRLNRTASRLAIAAIAIGNMMYWGSYDGFLAQQLVLCLIPGIMAVGFALLDEPGGRTAILAAVLFSPLFASYEFALIYPGGALGVWLLVSFLRSKTLKMYVRPLTIFAGSLVLMNIFVFIRRGFSLKDSVGSPEFSSALARSGSGDIHYYTPLSEMLGLNVHQHFRVLPLEGLTALPYYTLMIGLLTAAVVLVLIAGLYKTNVETRWKIIAIGIPFAAVALITRCLTFPYAYYKNIALAEPFVLIAFGLGVAVLAGGPIGTARAVPTAVKGAVIVIAVSFFGLNLYSLAVHEGYILNNINKTNSAIVAPSRDVIALRSQMPIKSGTLMIGANVPDTQQLWMLYFLRASRLRLEKTSVYLISWGDRFTEKSIPDYAIYAAGYDISADIRFNKQPVWRNAGYVLYGKSQDLLAPQTRR